jgi:hypothetical protein
MYYLYHIKGVKIGCSTQPKRRVERQGYTEYDILETHTDIDVASVREKKLQKEYGYRVDNVDYKESYKWACKGSSNGGKIAMSNPINVDNFKKVASKNAVANSLKSRYKLQKAVLQYDLDGNFIKEWPGVRYVKTHTNICCSKCVRGLKKTAGGYIWKFKS